MLRPRSALVATRFVLALSLSILPACSLIADPAEGEDDDEDRGGDDPPALPPCEVPEDCVEGRVCIDEVCRVACTADEECRGFYDTCDVATGGCVQCVDAGDCDEGEICTAQLCEDGGQTVCEPNVVGCVDDATAFVCNGDGTERTEAPCRADQVCEGGQCLLLVCEPGVDSCSGNTLVACSADGTDSVATSCDDASLCSSALGCACVEGACEARTCEPLSGQCVGNSARRCDAQGLAYGELADCGAELCVEGLCLNDTCTVGTAFCSGSTLLQCDADGVGYDVVDCPETCDGPIGEAACTDRVCEPLAQSCDGDVLIVCDATGTEQLEVPCAADQFCMGGACLDQACTPNARTCLGDDVVVCNAQGSSRTTEDCGTDRTCANGQCVDEACEPVCGARECGPDPVCGASCGTCAGTCDASGQCQVVDGPVMEVIVSWTDLNGIDVDAYLARGDTPMCDADTCGFNTCKPNDASPPNWDGTSGRSAADPLLDVVDGINDNPEIIRVTLGGAQNYRAGAHVFNDGNANGDTARSITLRVLLDGVQKGTFTRTLQPKMLWDGVDISWNGTTLTASDNASTQAAFACDSVPAPTSCDSDDDCAGDQICVDDGSFLSPNVLCREGCRSDNDCDGTDICNGNNDCAPAGSVLPWKAPCSSDSNCDVGFTCGFLSQVCEEPCLPGCTPGSDCCELSGGDTCLPDAFIGLFGSCEP